MPGKVGHVAIGVIILSISGAAGLTTSGVWNLATSWAQEADEETAPPHTAAPSSGHEEPVGRPPADAQNQPGAPSNILTVRQQEATEPGDVIHHTYGFGQEDYEQQYVTRNYLLITSKTDEVTIKKVIGNRGNCNVGLGIGLAIMKGLLAQGKKGDERGQGDGSAGPGDEPIATLKFGQTTKLQIDCTNLIEAEIQTDKGSVTFDWNN